jgi:hypothetical protein
MIAYADYKPLAFHARRFAGGNDSPRLLERGFESSVAREPVKALSNAA